MKQDQTCNKWMQDPEITTALVAVAAAARLCRKAQSEISEIRGTLKDDRSPVTVADFGAQALICARLKESFPDDAVIAEEESGQLISNLPLRRDVWRRVKNAAPDLTGLESEGDTADMLAGLIDFGRLPEDAPVPDRFWTLDPIDGTKGFLRGDQYAVALALIENGKLSAGFLGVPNFGGPSGSIFFAKAGCGAFHLNSDGGDMTEVSANSGGEAALRFCESVETAHAAHELHAEIGKRAGITAPPFRMDSQAKYAAVAAGEAAVYLRLPRDKTYREKIWDHAAGALVVTEAGGKVSDFSGNELDFSRGKLLVNNHGILAARADVHERVLGAIREMGLGG